MADARQCVLFFVPERYTAPSHGRTVSSCAIAKSFPNIPSSSPISTTMKLHFMTRVPRVTVSLALPRHSSAHPSTEHSRPQYLVSLSSAWPHFLQVRAATIDTPDPVSTRKLTPFPSIRPGRYSPFPTMTDSSVAAPSRGPASIVTAATVRFQSVLQ